MNDEPLDERQLGELGDALATLRRELETQASLIEPSTRPVQLDQQSVGRVSRIDALAQQAMDSARQQHGSERLRQVIVALARLESGDYGYCRQCDESIPYRRLKAQPETALCLACQQREESGG